MNFLDVCSKNVPLVDIAKFCRERIESARADGVEIDNGNVVDLIADNSNVPLDTIRHALVVAGYGQVFQEAIRYET